MPDQAETSVATVPASHSVHPSVLDSMGVGDVTGPMGIVLAVVLGLDRFGLLRRDSAEKGGDHLSQRDRLTRIETDVRHLHHRLSEVRTETQAVRDRTAATLDQIREDIRKELNR